MHDAKKEMMRDLIKYLRKKEMEDGDSKEYAEVTLSEKEEGEPMETEKKRFIMEDGEDGGEMLDLEEPDLDVEDEEDEEALTPAQEKIRDFFNNRRPDREKRSGPSRTFYPQGKGDVAKSMPRGRGRPKRNG